MNKMNTRLTACYFQHDMAFACGKKSVNEVFKDIIFHDQFHELSNGSVINRQIHRYATTTLSHAHCMRVTLLKDSSFEGTYRRKKASAEHCK